MRKPRVDDPVASLPPDEKQIIEILKAISFDPWMIILDEATANLDPETEDKVSAFRERNRDRL